jgi:DNA-directed RNA polymerase specialized sigma24 family protein
VRDNPAASPEADSPAERTRRIGSDPAALEAFYAEHYADVVRYFTRRLRDPHSLTLIDMLCREPTAGVWRVRRNSLARPCG